MLRWGGRCHRGVDMDRGDRATAVLFAGLLIAGFAAPSVGADHIEETTQCVQDAMDDLMADLPDEVPSIPPVDACVTTPAVHFDISRSGKWFQQVASVGLEPILTIDYYRVLVDLGPLGEEQIFTLDGCNTVDALGPCSVLETNTQTLYQPVGSVIVRCFQESDIVVQVGDTEQEFNDVKTLQSCP